MSNLFKSASLEEQIKHIEHALPKKILKTDADYSADYRLETEQQQLEHKVDHLEAQIRQKHEEMKDLQERHEQLNEQIRTDLQEAEEQIRQWWIEKEKEAEQMLQDHAQAGRETGLQEGLQQGLKQYDLKLAALQELIELAYLEKQRIIDSSEPFLLSLSTHIASKIIQKQLHKDDQIYLNIIRNELAQIKESGEILVELSVELFALVQPFTQELEQVINSQALLKIIPKPKQEGCMIHTNNGSYDVSIDHQLKELKKSIMLACEEGIGNGTA